MLSYRSLALSVYVLVVPGVAFSPVKHHASSVPVTVKSTATAADPSTATSTTTTLNKLAKFTTLSIDSGDLDAVAKFAATGLVQDATTCPFQVATAAQNGDDRYQDVVFDAIQYTKLKLGGGDVDVSDPEFLLTTAMDKISVNLGAKLLELVPGRVHTEVDIRVSYDKKKSLERARGLIAMYEEMGIPRERVVIKLAGTWEGIEAAKELEKEGISTNITLVFSFLQVAAAAQAGCQVVSPFPGRILDWYKEKSGRSSYIPVADPGVLMTKRMYAYLHKYGYNSDTTCMPASWRSSTGGTGVNGDLDVSDLDQVLALAGVDQMTLPVAVFETLVNTNVEVTQQVDATQEAATCCDPDFKLTRETWDMYIPSDPCVMDKFEEGLRLFKSETERLKTILLEQW